MKKLTALLSGLLFALAVQGREPVLAEIRVEQLPPEAHQTLALIRKGGPYPFRQDGVRFGNREKRLPLQGPEHYREFTVVTPGARDRGARRIVTGGTPPVEYFYTDDHYRNFRRIRQ